MKKGCQTSPTAFTENPTQKLPSIEAPDREPDCGEG
jgi:hypothetical protein